MKNFTFIAAAALAIGLGFGFSKPAEARQNKCDNPNYNTCVAGCVEAGVSYRACQSECCFS